MQRVVTSFGLGQVETLPLDSNGNGLATVLLDRRSGRHQLAEVVLPGNQVFLFGSYALLRLVNLGSKLMSQLSFFPTYPTAQLMLYIPTPANETAIVLDLDSGVWQSNRPLSFLAENGLLVSTWVDRWGEEPMDVAMAKMNADGLDSKRALFSATRELSIGTTEGISADLFLRPTDLRLGALERFCVDAPSPTGNLVDTTYEQWIN